MLTRAEYSALAAAAQRDPQALIEKLCWIRTKQLPGQAAVARLVFNKAQQRIHEAILAQREAGEPPRIVILKARQPGASTLCAAYAMATALSFPYADSMIVAHEEEATQKLYEKVRFMRDRLPDELRPEVAVERRTEFVLDRMPCADGEVALRTLVACHTSGGAEPWRSMTLQLVHLSEYAQMPYPENVLLGIMQCVPKTPQSLVVVESTAQGMGDAFHDLYTKATGGQSAFRAVFIPWFDVPEYRMRVPADFEPDADERELKRAFGLDHEQLQWRRYTIHTDCHSDESLFDQEHPTTAASAFVSSGTPAFSRKILEAMHDDAQHVPGREGILSDDGGVPRFLDLRGGPVTIFKLPVEGHDYTLGADPSTGEGEDPAAAAVYDRDTGEYVAHFNGYIHPVPFAQLLVALGTFYHLAILACEMTGGWGFAVIEELKMLQYQRLYVWQRVDKLRHSITNWYGWETSHRTRPLLLDSFAFGLSDGDIKVHHQPTIMELISFQRATGRTARRHQHDDNAMASMIAYRVHLEMPLERTGAPPRARHGGEGLAQAPAEAKTEGLRSWEADAWEDADKELARRRSASEERLQDQYGITDPGAPQGLEDEPEIPY